MRVDLHVHSNASDGTDSPAELVARARAADLDVIGLADHDSTLGWLEAMTTAQTFGDIEVIPAVEISCRRERVGVHMVAYGIDPRFAELADELARIRNDRVPRARAIVRRLGAAGVPVTWEDVLGQVKPGTVLGRPHIADALVARGVVNHRNEAFAKFLNRSSPAFVAHRAIDPVAAVHLVAAADGVSVLAHPRAARGGKGIPEDLISEMTQAGLVGIEVDHPDHDPADRKIVRALAKDLGLLMMGSSDYHGTGKLIRIGQELTDPQQYEGLREAMSSARWGWTDPASYGTPRVGVIPAPLPEPGADDDPLGGMDQSELERLVSLVEATRRGL